MSWQCSACLQVNPPGTKFCGHCGERAASDVAESLAASIAELTEQSPELGEQAEERRLITVVFADISGYTTLADRLDPEEVAETIDPILHRMARIIERYDGHVHQYAGDAIVAFFGAPVSHEDDAVRAVLAARDMHREVPELVATLPQAARQLTLHLGVNTGHVVTGFRGGRARLDYYAVGDAVNVAQRLEAACPSGDVYVGQLTYELAKKALPFASVGELTMKGKPEPVGAWRLASAAAPVDAPRHSTVTMFGRETELAAVRRALDRTATGEAFVLGIAGEPGVGKSRLLQEMREHALAAGVRWQSTRCLSYGAGLAYRPYLDLVRDMAGVTIDEAPETVRAQVTALALAEGVAEHAPFLVHASGVRSPDIPPAILDNPQALRQGVHEAIGSLVVAIAGRAPLVVSIEDVHWMDNASRDLTKQLVARAADVALGLALTSRPEGVSIVEEMSDGQRAPMLVELAGIDAGAVGELARAIVGGELDERTRRLLVERTGGNALFVQEVVRTLVDADALVRGPAGWMIDAERDIGEVPSSIEAVLAARIDLLPREAADVLQVASVAGRNVRLELLREMVPYKGEALDRIVDVLVEREFLDRIVESSEPRVVFHHALVGDVAYGRLLRRRRRELHRRLFEVGVALYGAGDDVIDLVARNAYLGGIGADALPYIVRAADRAKALFANAEAMAYLRQAVEIAEADRPGDLPDLLLRMGELQERTGAFEHALETYERASELSGDVRAKIRMAVVVSTLGRMPECLRMLDDIERDHPELTQTQLARIAVERGRNLSRLGRTAEAVRGLQDALTALAAADADNSTSEAELLVALARAEELMGLTDNALPHAERAVGLLEARGDLPRLATALRVLGGVQGEGDDPDLTGHTLERALSVARQVGHAEEVGAASTNLGDHLFRMGRHEEALAHDREAITAFESMGIKGGVANAKLNLSDALIALGRLDEAKRAAQEALDVARDVGHQEWVGGATLNFARIAVLEGDYATAVTRGEEAEEMFSAMGSATVAAARETAAEARRLMNAPS